MNKDEIAEEKRAKIKAHIEMLNKLQESGKRLEHPETLLTLSEFRKTIKNI